MLILVVHNGSHHADNVLRLAEEIVHGDANINLAVFCESKDRDRLQTIVGDPATRIVALSQHIQATNDNTPSAQASMRAGGVVSRMLGGSLGVYLALRKKVKGQSTLGDLVLNAIEYNSLACFLREKRVVLRYNAQIRETHRLFDILQPDIVLAWGDRHLDLELPALVVARRRNVKVLLPYVSFSSYRSLLWSRRLFGEPKRWTPFSLYRFIANLRLSAMTREGYFFQEPHVLYALKKLGALSRNPWTIGCGLSHVVCVDSAMTLRRYIAEGVPAEKLCVIGSPEFDSLYQGMASRAALRQRIAGRYKLVPSKGIIIIALPQFAEQGVLSWSDHWSEIRYILAQLSQTGRSILVSLHPRVEYDSYRFLEDEFSVRLSVEPLKKILPAADAFVAANSSTLVWAVLCGIQAFMLDCYGLESSDFKKFKSITSLENRASLLRDLMEGLTAEANFAEDWEMLSRDGVFDGGVIERYRKLVYDVMKDAFPRGIVERTGTVLCHSCPE